MRAFLINVFPVFFDSGSQYPAFSVIPVSKLKISFVDGLTKNSSNHDTLDIPYHCRTFGIPLLSILWTNTTASPDRHTL